MLHSMMDFELLLSRPSKKEAWVEGLALEVSDLIGIASFKHQLKS